MFLQRKCKAPVSSQKKYILQSQNKNMLLQNTYHHNYVISQILLTFLNFCVCFLYTQMSNDIKISLYIENFQCRVPIRNLEVVKDHYSPWSLSYNQTMFYVSLYASVLNFHIENVYAFLFIVNKVSLKGIFNKYLLSLQLCHSLIL